MPTLQYKACKKEELKGFTKARNLSVSYSGCSLRRRPLKRDYVQALTMGDHNATFRFLDLSAELRNRVYDELLIIKTKTRTCHPQILSTCRQINNEASGILHGDNKFHIAINRAELCVNKAVLVRSPLTSVTRSNLSTMHITWPDFLRRAWKLEFVVETNAWHDSIPACLNNILYSLCCFLQDKHQLRSLYVDWQGLKSPWNAEPFERTWTPLQLLGKIRELVLVRKNLTLRIEDQAYMDPTMITGQAWQRYVGIAEEVQRRLHGTIGGDMQSRKRLMAGFGRLSKVEEFRGYCGEEWEKKIGEECERVLPELRKDLVRLPSNERSKV